MTGDDRSRHCALCKHNVYNLSDMTRDEAEDFLQRAEGRTCIRYYQREDGKIMTKDCPRGVSAARRKFALALTAVFAMGCSLPQLVRLKPIPKEKFEAVKTDLRAFGPIKAILDKIDPPAPPVYAGMMLMPTPPPTSPPKGP